VVAAPRYKDWNGFVSIISFMVETFSFLSLFFGIFTADLEEPRVRIVTSTSGHFEEELSYIFRLLSRRSRSVDDGRGWQSN
jgi:hypothetical protein